jgi:hypothetical protein
VPYAVLWSPYAICQVPGVSFHVELFFGSKTAWSPSSVISSGSWVLYTHFVSSLNVLFGEGVFIYLNPSIGAARVEVQVDDLRRSTNFHTSQIQSVVLVFDLSYIMSAPPSISGRERIYTYSNFAQTASQRPIHGPRDAVPSSGPFIRF